MPTSICGVSSLHIAIGAVTSVKLVCWLSCITGPFLEKAVFLGVFSFHFHDCWAYDIKYLCHTQVLTSATSCGFYVPDRLIPLCEQKGEMKSANELRSRIHVWNSRRRLLLLIACSVCFRSQKFKMLKISENSQQNY